MKKRLKLITVLLIFMLVIACSNSPVFDTSSEDAKKKSAEKIVAELSSKDQKRFKEIITTLYALAQLTIIDETISTADILDSLDDRLNGKTAKEIVEIYDEIVEKMTIHMEKMKKNKDL